MLLEVKSFACHDCFWTDGVRYSAFRGKMVQQLDGCEHNVYQQKSGNAVEWKAVPYGTGPFFDYPDSTFDFRDVLVSTC